MPSAVQIESATKVYGSTKALDNVSLHIDPGQMVALLGPSGCGKTSLLRAIAGLNPLDRGAIRIGESDVTMVPARLRPIGMVFQHYALFPNMTVAENISFPLTINKQRRAERAQRVGELLELIGMTALADRYPNQLSGGQQQRVALARALAPEPDVLLLDEPLAALDAAIRNDLRDEIRRIQHRVGTTAVFVTHDQSEAMAVADRVAVMDRGRILEVAAPPEIYERPTSRFAATFVGSRNALELPSTPTVSCDGARHSALRPRMRPTARLSRCSDPRMSASPRIKVWRGPSTSWCSSVQPAGCTSPSRARPGTTPCTSTCRHVLLQISFRDNVSALSSRQRKFGCSPHDRPHGRPRHHRRCRRASGAP